MADNIDVTVRAQIEAFQAAMKQVKDQIDSVSGGLKNFADMATGIGEALAAVFASEKVLQWAEGVAEAGEKVVKLHHELGMSVEAVSTIGAAFTAMGMDSDSAGMALIRMNRNIVQAREGSPQAEAAFKAIGIAAADLKTMSPEEVLGKMADRFSETADGADKTAVAMAILGRSGAQMIPFLDRGREGLEEFKRIAEETGTVLSEEMAEGMEQTAIGMHIADLSFKGLGYTLFEALKPAIDSTVAGTIELVEWFNHSIKEGGALNSALAVLVIAFDLIRATLMTLISTFSSLWTIAKAGVQEATVGVLTFLDVWKRLQNLDFSGAKDAMRRGFDQMKLIADTATESLDKSSAEYRKKMAELFSNISIGPDGLPKVDVSGKGEGHKFIGGEKKTGDDELHMDTGKTRLTEWKTALDEMKDAWQEQYGALMEYGKAKEVEFWTEKLELARGNVKEYKAVLHEVVQAKKAEGTEEMAAAVSTLKAQQDAAKNDEERQKAVLATRLSLALAAYGEDSAKYKAVVLEKQKLDEEWTKRHREMQESAMQFEQKGQLEGVRMAEEHAKALQGLGLMSMEQLVAAERQLADDKLKIETDYLDKKLALQRATVDDPKKIQETQQAIEQAHRDHASRMLAIDDEAAKNTVNLWAVAVKTIQGAFDTMLDGVLRGTQTWEQAMANLFTNLEITFIKNVANMMLEWAAFQAGLTAVDPFGSGGISLGGILAAGVGAKPNAQIIANTTALNADTTALTALTAAIEANTAAVSSSVGASGATGGASLLEMAGAGGGAAEGAGIDYASMLQMGMIALQTGAWEIPKNMPAFLHAGEMVLPAEIAQKVRGGGGLATQAPAAEPTGGGSSSGHTIIFQGDVYGFDDFQSKVADALASAGRNFNSSLSTAGR